MIPIFLLALILIGSISLSLFSAGKESGTDKTLSGTRGSSSALDDMDLSSDPDMDMDSGLNPKLDQNSASDQSPVSDQNSDPEVWSEFESDSKSESASESGFESESEYSTDSDGDLSPDDSADPEEFLSGEEDWETDSDSSEDETDPTGKQPKGAKAGENGAGPVKKPGGTTASGKDAVSIVISAAGDCTFGDDTNSGNTRFAKAASKYGYSYFLQNVKGIFSEDDLTIVNLEGPLTTSKKKRPNRQFNFRGLPEYVQILTLGNVEAANTANNHNRDFGSAGRDETFDVLDSAGITGFGMDRTAIVDVKGIRVGLIGLTEWDYTAKKVTENIAALKENCDLCICVIHWGKERVYQPTSSQQKYAKACVEGGADLVLGGHSHVIGGIELINDTCVVYSLGNFCFGGNANPSDKDTMIFQQRFTMEPDGTVSHGDINVIPCTVSTLSNTNDYCPTPATGDAGKNILKRIRKLTSKFASYPSF